MAERKPLAGWHVTLHGRGELRGGGVFLNAWPDGVWQARTNGPRPARVCADDLLSAQLAAEDAARAMVAGMAAALGGRVVWGTPCPGCGATEPDIVVNGETQCGRCGMIGAPVESEGGS